MEGQRPSYSTPPAPAEPQQLRHTAATGSNPAGVVVGAGPAARPATPLDAAAVVNSEKFWTAGGQVFLAAESLRAAAEEVQVADGAPGAGQKWAQDLVRVQARWQAARSRTWQFQPGVIPAEAMHEFAFDDPNPDRFLTHPWQKIYCSGDTLQAGRCWYNPVRACPAAPSWAAG